MKPRIIFFGILSLYLLYTASGQVAPTSSDVNQDGLVNFWDFVRVARYYGGEAKAYPAADVDGDGYIDHADIDEIFYHYEMPTAARSTTTSTTTVYSYIMPKPRFTEYDSPSPTETGTYNETTTSITSGYIICGDGFCDPREKLFCEKDCNPQEDTNVKIRITLVAGILLFIFFIFSLLKPRERFTEKIKI